MNQELERLEPAEAGGRILHEHLHRYAICRDRVAGQRVLDVACGTGYGTNILAQVAAQATGVDIDAAAIRSARRRYRRQNLKFVAADCCEMPFEDGSFDVVTANEMIEHIEDHDAFIEEVKRVLQPGGMFLVSTPNKPIYNRYKSPNPFHVSEMDIAEFRDLLESHFKHVHFTGLRMALVSASFDIDGPAQVANLAAAKTYRGFREGNGKPNVSNDEMSLDEPEYVLALCSDRAVEQDAAASTIFFSADDDLWSEHEKIMAWASQLHEEDEVLRADLRRSQAELEESRSALAEERRAHADRIDTPSVDNQQHLTISSRLLTRLTGSPVEPDPVAMVEAMFSLNEQLITQRSRLDGLAGAQRRAEELQSQIDAIRAERDELSGEFRSAQQRIDDLGGELEALRSERNRLVADVADIRQKLSDEVRQAQQRIDDLGGELETLRGERDRLEADLAETRNESEKAREEQRAVEDKFNAFKEASSVQNAKAQRDLIEAREMLAKLKRDVDEKEAQRAKIAQEVKGLRQARPETSVAEGPSSRGTAATTQISSGRQRQAARLSASHAKVHQQLAAAHGAISFGSVAHDPVGQVSMFSRLTRSHPLRDTAVFDRAWVARQLPGGASISINKYFRNPAYHGLDPHPLFAAAEYLDRYPDVAEAGISPLEHYLRYGWREGRNPHAYFMNDWYLLQYPDVLKSGLNPLEHYLRYGWREGRKPNPVFDPVAYLDRHDDVKAAGVEPLSHYAAYGRAEEREVPFEGLEQSWRMLVASPDRASLMDHLLFGVVTEPPTPEASRAPSPSGEWPPSPLNDYALPQRLRDFLIDAHGEESLSLYSFLYSVMDAWSEAPSEFPASDACYRILNRLRSRSRQLASMQRGRPAASIVVPVYNNFLDTLLCLASLLEVESTSSFEIIVADDWSSDSTADIIPSIGGVVRHLRQPANLGFLGNCNAAVETATGNLIVLLNNDTLILPGWLDALLAPFDRDEPVGLVGSKLINWDGTLQEAGGIFWKDGSAWNFGRGQDPRAPEFNYLKEVDYCSGASIAVPASLWRQLGGFDPQYSPAYCEDSDLAFRIRAEGYQTLLNPLSEVIHHEGRSHGRDTGTGIKAYQVTNQKRLLERWGDVLKRDHFSNGENVLRARDRSGRKPHILVVDHYVPQADKDAGSRTIFQFLEVLLRSGWAVTFWPENLYRDPIYTPAIQELGVEVIYGAGYVHKFGDFLRSRADLYDAVLLSRPHVATHFIDDVRSLTSAKVLYYGHDVHFARMKAQRDVAEATIEEDAVAAMKAMEVGLCNQCDVILYPSEDESRLMAKHVTRKVQSIAIPAYRFTDDDLRAGQERAANITSLAGGSARLLFVGGFAHGPNVDGIAWFCSEVVPILRREGFSFNLDIAGSNPTSEVWDLEDENIRVLGYISDQKLRELYRDTSLVIAPLRFGAGVKGKVVEAMGNGVPVVTTDVGAQGLLGADDYLFLGGTPENFAAAVKMAADPATARARATAALEYVRTHYSETAMSAVFERVLERPCSQLPSK